MTPLLSLCGVSKTYVRGTYSLKVLADESFEVHDGAFVAVFGERSSGKTTLLKISAGLERPDSGTVEFAGKDLNRLSASALASVHRTKIAWVDRAGPRSDELTMVDHIALPLLSSHGHGTARRMAIAALAEVSAKECALALWSDLSDAERAHVSIAHALVREPQLLVLDDPTAGLDIVDRERILQLLRTTAEQTGAGVLMAVPDVPAMVRSHEVWSLSGGRLIGPPPQELGVVLDFPLREQPGQA